MKNKMVDLNNHLFEQLERLNDDELKGDGLKEEIERARAMASIATQIIANGALALKARAIQDNAVGMDFRLPEVLED